MDEQRYWHRALLYALTGDVRTDLGSQPRPDLDQLWADLNRAGPTGLDDLRDTIRRRRHSDSVWPVPVPDDLREGLGAAQFAAALRHLIDRLDLDEQPRPVLSSRAPDAAEQRLLRDVPPHHGS